MRLVKVLAGGILVCVLAFAGDIAAAQGIFKPDGPVEAPVPDPALAAQLFSVEGPVSLTREESPAPGWLAFTDDGPIGRIASTWEIARSTGYSGRPIDVLVAVSADGHIAGAQLVRHNEPILTLGISTSDIAAYVDGFAGVDLTKPQPSNLNERSDLPDVISRATVSTGVIRDSILRTARTLAMAHRTGSGIDTVSFEPMSWDALAAAGALANATATLADARVSLDGAATPIPSGDGMFLDLWTAVIDPPSIGRNLLGQQDFSRVMATLGPGDAALFVASRGLHSHRGTAWRRDGTFDRITVIQAGTRISPRKDSYLRIDRLRAGGAPEFKEMSMFRMPADRFDAASPFEIEVSGSRKTASGTVSMLIPLQYALPEQFLTAPEAMPEQEPLWISAWERKRVQIAGVGIMLAALAGILFFQEAFVRRPALWFWGRIGFLSITLFWLGWVANGQLSVVQVIAFMHSLLTGFHWETFLIEPLIFLLWGFVALGLLFWGRGVYCGWLCPFGALQELTNELAQRLRVPQIEVPYGLHERLWVIKYTLFMAILALSFYSMDSALRLAEAEPFKTAISMRFLRAWPFLLFVGAILVAGLFIERFYCRYLCPLGAALAIPAKLKIFDWLRRRPQCGRECRLCQTKCTVGAIDPIGRINPNECVLCLRCQMIFNDPATCPVLKRRARPAPAAGAKP